MWLVRANRAKRSSGGAIGGYIMGEITLSTTAGKQISGLVEEWIVAILMALSNEERARVCVSLEKLKLHKFSATKNRQSPLVIPAS